MTITETVNYTLGVYVEQGWITPKQAKQIEGEGSIMFWGLFVAFLLGVILFMVRANEGICY